ncbi:ribosome-associated heat shock protein implicated in recycling of 50S subunit [Schinkia azotoformans MEV2011]|uniref:RQC P-site tRNA stabilizing factor n=2 Tax=Schinkia azotoformans TaxID=1454 RepID=A0A072NHM6_SCHAZ|nr:ribosome-associated heat shock protein implicated in recycling of 50S subunit [Schinkia azotoformans MEV2011]
MEMRLDKFLKVSRLIKRRTLAKEVADQGRISINGVQAKASSNVKVGDELTIRFGQKLVTVKIDAIKDTTKKEDAASMYTVVKEEKIQNKYEETEEEDHPIF